MTEESVIDTVKKAADDAADVHAMAYFMFDDPTVAVLQRLASAANLGLSDYITSVLAEHVRGR